MGTIGRPIHAAVILLSLLVTVLAGCGLDNRGLEEPPTTAFELITESDEFRAETELVLQPHPEQDGAGQGLLDIRVISLSESKLNNLKVVVYFPDEMVDMALTEKSVILPPSGNPIQVGPDRPSFRIRQWFEFPDWDQVEEVETAVLNPIRLRLVWDQGERYLEIPMSEIKVKQASINGTGTPEVSNLMGTSGVLARSSYRSESTSSLLE